MNKHFDKTQCRQKGISTSIVIIIIIAAVVVAVVGFFAYQYFAPKTQPVVQTQQTVAKPDFLFSIVNKNVEIRDKNTGNLIQTIPLNKDVLSWNSNPQIKDVAILNNDINFDGYNDLAILSQVPASNPGIFDFYTYTSSTGKFEKDSVLKNIGGPVFDANTKTISTEMSGGCVGRVSSRKIFSFINGKYTLTQTQEKRCCPDNVMNDGKPGITINNYNDGKIISTTQESCPTQQ